MLSDIQKEMVEYLDTPCVISAGAGSGKSRVITYKFDYLVNTLNFEPDRILCITFTNKAANELKRRLSTILNIDLSILKWVRTIHSACFKMIKENLENYGYNKHVSIYTDSEKKKILKNILKDSPFNKSTEIIPYFLKLINNYKYVEFNNENELIDIIYKEIIPDVFKDNPIIKFDKELHGIIYDLFVKYIFEMKNKQSLDYDDILFYTKRLLKDDQNFKDRIQKSFDYVLVDEYQDVDDLQNYIIKNICRKNITIVGDDYQSIYRFRGANPKIFINYEESFPNAKLFKLERNYRSTKQIVNVANKLIKNNKKQIHKNCYSIKEGPIPNIKFFQSFKEESINIAKACSNLVKSGKFEYNDIAIIYRTRMISRTIERELIKLGLPYILIGDVEFFQRREIKDIISYLEFTNNKNNKLMFDRSITSPRRGISISTLDRTLSMIPEGSIYDKLIEIVNNGILNKKQHLEVSKYLDLIKKIEVIPPQESIRLISSNEKFIDYIRNISNDEEDFMQRQENILELINVSMDFSTIEEFLEDIFLNYTSKNVENKAAIQLMTGHASKGLEFKTVFLVGAEEQTLPHIRSLVEKNKILRDENIEEERRLFYVMLTRAESLLTITWCKDRTCSKNLQRSRFVTEIENLLNKI